MLKKTKNKIQRTSEMNYFVSFFVCILVKGIYQTISKTGTPSRPFTLFYLGITPIGLKNFSTGVYKEGEEVKSNTKQADKITCLKCGKAKATHNYYVNSNPLFATDKLHVCKGCIIDFIGKKDSAGFTDRIKLVLALMNKPFIEEIFESSERDWGKYIPQLSSLPNYKGKSFSDSSFSPSSTISVTNIETLGHITDEELKELELMWGRGFEVDDYLFLENQYETLLNSYECESYAQEMLFQEIAHQRLAIKKNREASKPTDKEMKTLQDLLGSSNIKPVQETGANAAEQATFGTLIKKYENERPVPEPDPAWADVDGIKKYISIWFLGHLCRMLGINNDYSKMYDNEIAKFKVEAPEYEQEDDEGAV